MHDAPRITHTCIFIPLASFTPCALTQRILHMHPVTHNSCTLHARPPPSKPQTDRPALPPCQHTTCTCAHMHTRPSNQLVIAIKPQLPFIPLTSMLIDCLIAGYCGPHHNWEDPAHLRRTVIVCAVQHGMASISQRLASHGLHCCTLHFFGCKRTESRQDCS